MCVFTKKAPVCGGIVDKSDKKALKTIKSEKLTSFSVSFYLYGKLGRKTGSSYRISVVKNDAGRYVLSEEENNISCETDENYLKRIHEVIVKK